MIDQLNLKCFYKTDNSIYLFLATTCKNIFTKTFLLLVLVKLKTRYKNIHVFLIPWWCGDGVVEYNLIIKHCTTVTILTNSVEELNLYPRNIPAIFCNQNCWLDSNLFTVRNCPKEYDIVINAHGEKWKGHSLIENLNFTKLFITPSEHDLSVFKPTKILKKIDPENVCYNLSKCKVGLALSYEEGSCYASTEYLLCGIPVVSVKSKGGRDVWYNEINSIIVSNESELKDAIQFIIDTPHNYNAKIIRNNAIELQTKFKQLFFDYIRKTHYIQDIEDVINKNFVNKMLEFIDIKILTPNDVLAHLL